MNSNSIVFPDANPMRVQSGDVVARGAHTVPDALREVAGRALALRDTGEWWTVGEFRDDDGEFTTAVARRLPGGVVEYGTSD